MNSALIEGDIYLRTAGDEERKRNYSDRCPARETFQFLGGDEVEYTECDDGVRAVSHGEIDVFAIVQVASDDQGTHAFQVETIYRDDSNMGLGGLKFIEDRLHAMNSAFYHRRLWSDPKDVRYPAQFTSRAVADQIGRGVSLTSLIPLVLILMTITGAVYPAIDLTAGERERGTLEPLSAAPVPRIMLLLAKYVAVVAVAMLTGIVNLLSMSITLWSSGLTHLVVSDGSSTVGLAVQTIGLLALFAAFFSAVLLVVTTFARSFKEAQAYLIPLMLISLAPGIVSLMPDLTYTPRLALVPLLNIVLLGRDLLDGMARPLTAILAIGCTILYAAAAIAVAARVFGTDAVLYGSRSGWHEFLRRPDEPRSAVSTDLALVCLALLFPAFFVVSHGNAQLSGDSPARQLLLSATGTLLLFGLVPLVIAARWRVDLRLAFLCRWPTWWGILGGLFLGVSLWPFALEILLRTQPDLSQIFSEQSELYARMADRLANLRAVPFPFILFTMAAIPALCEEVFFRGFLLTALEQKLSRWQAIFWSGSLFGLFHIVMSGMLFVERLLPATLLGLVLAWVASRTRSLLPGIILHATHNGWMLASGFEFQDFAWNTIAQQQRVPTAWMLVALAPVALGVAAIWMAGHNRPLVKRVEQSPHDGA